MELYFYVYVGIRKCKRDRPIGDDREFAQFSCRTNDSLVIQNFAIMSLGAAVILMYVYTRLYLKNGARKYFTTCIRF